VKAMSDTWGEWFKVPLVGVVGISVTGSTIDEWLRICIAAATLVYTIAKAGSAIIEFKRKRNEKRN
tara:strand:+ start:5585 stop:5782 length:198 start_codon:yes stop_codon:yes gene_type:complete